MRTSAPHRHEDPGEGWFGPPLPRSEVADELAADLGEQRAAAGAARTARRRHELLACFGLRREQVGTLRPVWTNRTWSAAEAYTTVIDDRPVRYVIGPDDEAGWLVLTTPEEAGWHERWAWRGNRHVARTGAELVDLLRRALAAYGPAPVLDLGPA